ncbi:MAG: transketolase, partial [Bdellovibrionales bacterium]|nr:transketolase [Bdellovibrionales bacterium]
SKEIPSLIGGSADLEPSNKTLIKGSADIKAGDFSGKNIRFGVREHGMGAVANGLAYSGDWIPYTATFLVFSDYMRPSIRLAALSHLKVLFIFTHESFWVGEDGPTHQPIEHIWSLRMIPNLYVFRPADRIETAMCYFGALSRNNGPSTLLFTRQNLTPIPRSENFNPDEILKGGYVVRDNGSSTITFVATGSEVATALAAAELLLEHGVNARVVSMPCLELFNEQSPEYRAKVLPADQRIVTLEAGSTLGWRELARDSGLCLGIDHFGASAPGEILAEKFGFVPEKVTERVLEWMKGI